MNDSDEDDDEDEMTVSKLDLYANVIFEQMSMVL